MASKSIAVKANNEWKVSIELDLKALASTVVKSIALFVKSGVMAAVNPFAAINPGDGIELASDLFSILKVKKEDAKEYKAYLLIYSAIRRALHYISSNQESILGLSLVGERAARYNATAFEVEMKKIINLLDKEEETHDFKIEAWFFVRPADLPIVEKVLDLFRSSLEVSGISSLAAQHLAGHFPAVFVQKLNELLSEKREYFQSIQDYFHDSIPYDEFENREDYDDFLCKNWKQDLSGENFSLSEVYVKLNAFYPKWEAEVLSKGEIQKYIVCQVEKQIEKWVQNPKPAYHIMVIKGGPGSGKSTLMRKLAFDLVNAKNHPVYFIPMNHLAVKDNLENTINEFIKTDPATRKLSDPFDTTYFGQKKKPFFIFDGLDELSRAGNEGEDIAHKLLHQIIDRLKYLNNDWKWNIRVLLTGRDLVIDKIQAELGEHIGQVLELLPYSIEADDRDWKNHSFLDSEELLQKDLRENWWQNYSNKLGKAENHFPVSIKRSKINAVSVQPILCYFISKLYFANELTNEVLSDPNKVYEALFKSHLKREIAKGSKSEALSFENYLNLLEILAQTTWQSGEIRATTGKLFNESLRLYGFEEQFDRFEKGLFKDGEGILVSFFTRILPNHSKGEQLIEFSHKTFGEYLVARRIISEAIRTSNFKKKKAKQTWLKLAASEEMTEYIWEFLNREVALRFENQKDEAIKIQNALVELFSSMINEGFPLKMVGNEKSNLDIIRASRNAEASLLLTISAFARVSGERSEIAWRDAGHPKRVLSRLMLGAVGLLGRGLFACVFPEKADFYLINLLGAHLEGAHLEGAHLEGAHLEGAHLEGAHLKRGNLLGANLLGAHLEGANLLGANLEGAILEDANLENAHLSRANLKNAKIYPFNLGEKLMKGQEAYDYLVKRGALNVPKP